MPDDSNDGDKEVSQAGYEKTDINTGMIGVIAVASIGFIVVSIIMLNEVFLAEKESLIYERVLSVESDLLIALHQREADELTSYKKIDSVDSVDSVNGRYRIPIERAMQLIAEESNTAGVSK